MKSLKLTAIIFGLFINVYAQVSTDSFKINLKKELTRTIQMEQSLRILKEVDFEMAPQFGGLFSKTFNEVIYKSIIKNCYKDFDFGLNLGIKYNPLKNLKFAILYNVGLLKFNFSNYGIVAGPVMKLSFEYWF